MKLKYLSIFGLFLIIKLGFHSQIQAQHIARIRFEDDFSYLKSDTTTKSWDERLKYMQISKDLNLSLGGELREQYQNYTHANFGQIPASFTEESPQQLMHRIMVHADLRFKNSMRLFAQVNNTARFLNPNPIVSQVDQNLFEVHQLFVEFDLWKKGRLRFGKQEMLFGQERVIASREGPNTRQNFIGLRINNQFLRGQLNTFVVRPTQMHPGAFDDELANEVFAGTYWVRPRVLKGLNLEAYYLYLESSQRAYLFNKGLEKRHTVGLHLYSPAQFINYDVELAHQWGQFNSLDISAWMWVWDFNVRFHPHVFLGFSGNYVPGDQTSSDQELNTFNTLFARPPFGLTVALNITNTLNWSPYIRYALGTKWLATARASFVQRVDVADGIYSPNMTMIRPLDNLSASIQNGICDIYAMDVNYIPNQHYSCQIELGFCQAGTYLKETGSGKDVIYFAIRNAIKF